jgi:hypothetical protein
MQSVFDLDMTKLERLADELPTACPMDTRLLYSIAISVKRLADLAFNLDKEAREEADRINKKAEVTL